MERTQSRAPVEYVFVAGAVVFVLTYVLISARKVGVLKIEGPAAAMLGAALMIVLGVVGPLDALQAINVNVLILLLGMMLLVAGLDACGFFNYLSHLIARRARTQAELLAALMVVAAVLSALVLNDTIALLMTPIVVQACQAMELDPVPFLVGEGIAVNVGSVATEIGNPQNAYIGIRSGIPFTEYALVMAPITAVCLAISIVIVAFAFRGRLAKPIAARPPETTVAPIHRPGLAFTLAVLLGSVAAFFLSAPAWLPVIALTGGSLVLFGLPVVNRKATGRALIGAVDWSILLFFIGLFIVIAGVERSGVRASIQGTFTFVSGGNAGRGLWHSRLHFSLSNLVSNVPAVLLLEPIVRAAPIATQRN